MGKLIKLKNKTLIILGFIILLTAGIWISIAFFAKDEKYLLSSLSIKQNSENNAGLDEDAEKNRIALNEAAAIKTLCHLRMLTYAYEAGNSEFPRSFRHLFEYQCFDLELASGEKQGYYFGYIPVSGFTFLIGAIPVRDGETGNREFLSVRGKLYEGNLESMKTNPDTFWIPGENGVPEEYGDYFLYGNSDIYGRPAIPFEDASPNWKPVYTKTTKRRSFKELVEAAGDIYKRYPAVGALQELKKMREEGVNKLLAVIKDSDQDRQDITNWKYRSEAARVLGYMDIKDHQKVVVELENLMRKERRNSVKAWTANALARITGDYDKYSQVVVSLRKQAGDDEALALGDWGRNAKKTVPFLIKSIEKDLAKPKDSCKRSRLDSDVIKALGEIGPDARDGTTVLIKILKRKKEPIYILLTTLNSLRKIRSNPHEVVPVLKEILQDKSNNWEIRWHAAKTLGIYGKKAENAIPALKECLKNNRLRLPATLALRQIENDIKQKGKKQK